MRSGPNGKSPQVTGWGGWLAIASKLILTYLGSSIGMFKLVGTSIQDALLSGGLVTIMVYVAGIGYRYFKASRAADGSVSVDEIHPNT